MIGVMALASSTRRVSTLFLSVALLFAGALGWLGWRLIQQDRALARQRRVEQLEAAADRVSAAMYRQLGELEEALADPERGPVSSDAVLLRARRDGVVVRPAGGLLYLPIVPAAPEPPPSIFVDGEALEFQRNDPAAAAVAFRRLTGSTDPAVRAGALLRLGRSLAKSDRMSEALVAFDELAAMGATPLGGLPAELVAREARCSLFERLSRASDLQREARLFYDALADGRFPLSRAGYEFKMEEARGWLAEAPDSGQLQQKAALSAAAQVLWVDWSREPAGKGRRLVTPDGRPILASWISGPNELTAVLVPAEAVGAALREAGHFQARLMDVEGRTVLGSPDMAGVLRVDRTPASTRLPWTLQVVSLDDGSAGLAGRQWILTGAFALLVVLLGAVSYLAARTTSRELAVARLQADFVSAVSHEFRSPLSSICQITELLNEDRLPSDEQRRQSFAILGMESARLRRLVEGLLDFTRMEAGVARYRLEPLAPEEMLRAVVEEFEAQPASRSHQIRLSISPGLPQIDADREALGRAVWNLLDNAVKYSPASTTIRVEGAEADGRLAISVRDEGPGIPAAEQKQIFRKFVRGSQAEASGVKGTGIGLAMVQHIVQGHGGELKLASTPGDGSTFTIVLPRSGV
jgi:two-component system, OmpR family, phosphate regulon sensor histidine kinase PhoR